jgi:hypothetical protein
MQIIIANPGTGRDVIKGGGIDTNNDLVSI